MSQSTAWQDNPFVEKFKGGFTGILRWHQLDELWTNLLAASKDDWYIYPVGEQPPEIHCSAEQLSTFIAAIDKLLREDHKENYCGIVYVDDKQTPAFIKIYDPHNLGHVCGSNGSPPPLPGWILSKLRPVDLQAVMPPTGNRRKWWQKIFS